MQQSVTNKFEIRRSIEIDAGHRVTYHGSTCRNLHGHRYKIAAHCRGSLFKDGEQQGMVLDFGFLKEEMVKLIHADCDHALILWCEDELVPLLTGWSADETFALRRTVAEHGFCRRADCIAGALYLIDCVPTAENLAAHWFRRLQPVVASRSNGNAALVMIEVFETPNCSAVFPCNLSPEAPIHG